MRHLIVAAILIAGSLLSVQAIVSTLEQAAVVAQVDQKSYAPQPAAPPAELTALPLPPRPATVAAQTNTLVLPQRGTTFN